MAAALAAALLGAALLLPGSAAGPARLAGVLLLALLAVVLAGRGFERLAAWQPRRPAPAAGEWAGRWDEY